MAAELEIGNASVLNANGHNLFGDSRYDNAKAFTNVAFAPGSTDINATRDGLNRPLSSILKPLADNGGPTQTHALAAVSAAIDAGDDAVCAALPINNKDQMGEARPFGPHCDIGAVEYIDDGSFFVMPIKNGKTVIFSF